MATYKVLQDIEAEDKLLGPLTLRQFIYAAIVLVSGFVAFKLGEVNLFLILPFVPVIVFFGLLAAPLGREQPNEVWLLARIRFFLKPRMRKWDQTGAFNPVTITIPKKIERRLTKNYTPGEVQSRLKALASTMDTRGWAIKNVNVNLFSQPSYFLNQDPSDRIIDPASIPKEVSNVDVTQQDDIFEENSPSAQHINEMLSANEKATKKYFKELATKGPVDNTQNNQVTPDYWFMNQAPTPSSIPRDYEIFQDSTVVSPGASEEGTIRSADENSIDPGLVEKVEHGRARGRDLAEGHMRVVEPLSSKKTKNTANSSSPSTSQTSVTSHPDNANISAWAGDNNLSVATLAHMANEDARKKDEPPEEVVISLH